jgi:hypothetical protein
MDELEGFKQIDLRKYLEHAGYEEDPGENTPSVTVMRYRGDKIHVRQMPNGHWVWHSFRDGRNGTIIDFAQSRQGISNLGHVRQRLRAWNGTAPPPSIAWPAAKPVTKDRTQVRERLSKMPIARRHIYLENERGIPAWVLESERFAGCVRGDDWGNAVFPHADQAGICGYEIRGRRWRGFSPGGQKGLWRSQRQPQDAVLVFCESGINCLSYATLYPDAGACCCSIAGQPSGRQLQLIREAIAEMTHGSRIVAAMDADVEGRHHATAIAKAFRSTGRSDLTFRQDFPEGANDWNDLLKLRGRLSWT